MRIELPEGMAQLLQNLADKLAHLAQGMIRRNAPLRLDIREHPALIEKLSAHRKSSCRISRESESSPLRFGEVFPQTARLGLASMACLMMFPGKPMRPAP